MLVEKGLVNNTACGQQESGSGAGAGVLLARETRPRSRCETARVRNRARNESVRARVYACWKYVVSDM